MDGSGLSVLLALCTFFLTLFLYLIHQAARGKKTAREWFWGTVVLLVILGVIGLYLSTDKYSILKGIIAGFVMSCLIVCFLESSIDREAEKMSFGTPPQKKGTIKDSAARLAQKTK